MTKMPNIYYWLGTFAQMKNGCKNKKAVKAYWDVGCWAYGKENLVKAAIDIDEYEEIKEYAI